LLALPLAAAEPLGKRLTKMCAQLRSAGWTVPLDPITGKPGIGEMNVPGVMYMCMLEHPLKGQGPGHGPEVHALFSKSDDASAVLEAHVYCQDDETPTFDALAKEFELLLGGVPAAVSKAVRARENLQLSADGLLYRVEKNEVDADACAHVQPGQLGRVRIMMTVSATPAKP
jgi:hypothetical protein